MPRRDYANKRTARKSHKARTKSTAGLWFNTGLLVLAFVAALVYLQNAPTPGAKKTPKNELVKMQAPTKVATLVPAKTTTDKVPPKPQFDFYTILSGEKSTSQVHVGGAQRQNGVDQENTSVAKADTIATVLSEQKMINPQASHPPTAVANNPVSGSAPVNQNQQAATVELPKPPLLNLSDPDLNHAKQESAPLIRKERVLAQEQNILNRPAKPSIATVKPLSSNTVSNTVKKKYILQIASVGSYEDADRLKAQLILLGFDVAVRPVRIGNRQWYRVNLGPYPSSDEAKSMQKQLASKGIKSILNNLK
jgi:cell division protein FtsN